jgi:hypothetical protein
MPPTRLSRCRKAAREQGLNVYVFSGILSRRPGTVGFAGDTDAGDRLFPILIEFDHLHEYVGKVNDQNSHLRSMTIRRASLA